MVIHVVVVVPASYRRYPKRLLALGHDARLLIDDLATMQQRGYYEMSGRTGELKLNNDRIERRLECAQFQNGVPVPLRQPIPSLRDNQPVSPSPISPSDESPSDESPVDPALRQTRSLPGSMLPVRLSLRLPQTVSKSKSTVAENLAF